MWFILGLVHGLHSPLEGQAGLDGQHGIDCALLVAGGLLELV